MIALDRDGFGFGFGFGGLDLYRASRPFLLPVTWNLNSQERGLPVVEEGLSYHCLWQWLLAWKRWIIHSFVIHSHLASVDVPTWKNLAHAGGLARSMESGMDLLDSYQSCFTTTRRWMLATHPQVYGSFSQPNHPHCAMVSSTTPSNASRLSEGDTPWA